MGPGQWSRRDRHCRAVVFERFPGPRFQQGVQQLVHQFAAPVVILAHRRIFDRAVSQTEGDGHPPATDLVDDREILGQPDRVPQRTQRCRNPDADVLGAGQNHATGEDRVAAPSESARVVLVQADQIDALGVGEASHLDGGAEYL